MDFAPAFAAGLSYREFLQRFGSDEHRRRWAGVHARVRLSADQQAVLAGFSRELHVLCLAGAWCGDCVNQCPIFDHFAAVSPAIQLRFIDRDEHAQFATDLKICGGARVPVVVFLAEDDQFLGLYGDRTLAKYRQMAATQLGAACPTGLGAEESALFEAVQQEWLNEFERAHLIARTSARLREKHGD